jgi:streptomycin 6-kinase
VPYSTSNAEFLNALPRKFKQNVLGVCGEEVGSKWLNSIPRLISVLEEQWGIMVGQYFPNISYNFVAAAEHENGSSLVVKLGLPANGGEANGERAYLRHLNGNGTVRLIEEDPKRNALLLERAVPGDHIRTLFKAEPYLAVDVAVKLPTLLRQKAPINAEGFITLESWARKLEDAARFGFPQQYAEKALRIFSEMDRNSLLHGDFHHENILSNFDSYLVIDPKGLIGDLRYDFAVFLNNHRGWMTDNHEELSNSINHFANVFGFTAKEIREMAFAQKVLSAFWTLTEGRDSWQRQLASADFWDV